MGVLCKVTKHECEITIQLLIHHKKKETMIKKEINNIIPTYSSQ
jgi:hypothetical protein